MNLRTQAKSHRIDIIWHDFSFSLRLNLFCVARINSYLLFIQHYANSLDGKSEINICWVNIRLIRFIQVDKHSVFNLFTWLTFCKRLWYYWYNTYYIG